MCGLLLSVIFPTTGVYSYRITVYRAFSSSIQTLVQDWKETISPGSVQFTSYGHVCVLDHSKIV